MKIRGRVEGACITVLSWWFGSLSLLLFLGLTAMAAPQTEKEPIVLNRQAELLLHDDWLVAQREGLELVPAQLRKHPANPLLGIDRPWEKRGILNYVALLQDEEAGLYRMYYQILGTTEDGVNQSHCLYAESRDGVRWEKPDLGLVDYEGSKQNNILFLDPNERPRGTPVYWVMKDYAERDPEQRYKMMLNRWDFRGRGVGMGYSADGIRWKFSSYVNRLGGFDTHNLFFWDDRIGLFVGYFRTHVLGKRSIGRATSPDAYHWSAPVTVHGLDDKDPPDWQIYGPGIFKYSRAKNVYVMYGEGFDSRSDVFRGQLGLSRDGIDWHRFQDGHFLDGTPGTWDAGSVRPVPAEAVVDGRMAMFYTGSDHSLHDREGARGVGLALFQQGAFSGWRAAAQGTLLTRPLLAKHSEPSLLLNVDAEGGEVVAEILDARGSVISGFSLQDCKPVTGKGTLLEVSWKGRENLKSVVQQGAFQVRFHLERATLYGFRIIRPGSAKALF